MSSPIDAGPPEGSQPPRRASPSIPLSRPLIGEEERLAVERVLGSGWLMQGPEVEAFEAALAQATGAAHAVALSSGTAALHLALLALGLGPGDEVVTVSHSHIATANSVALTGARPRFVDIEPTTLNLDPDGVEAAITPRTRALLVVHQLGLPCDLGALLPLARAHGLFVVEDAACALGAEVALDGRWAPIGKPHGDLACFSFHPRKIITTGEGGAVVTRERELAERVRRLRQHGMASASGPVEVVGFNYRLTDLAAALGRVQLGRLPAIVAERRAQAARYLALLAGLPGVTPPATPAWARPNWQSFHVRLERDAAPVVARLAEAGIAGRPGIMNAHQQPAFASGAPSLPCSELASRQCLILPLYPGLGADDQARVIEALRSAISP